MRKLVLIASVLATGFGATASAAEYYGQLKTNSRIVHCRHSRRGEL